MWQQNVLPRMILCMSSDEDELFQVGILLRNAGYEPFLCVEAPDALRSLSYFEVELIIADELLDTGAGLTVLKKARSFSPRIPVIHWIETARPPQVIVDLDPDVKLARSEGEVALLKTISIFMENAKSKDPQ